jgi:hypothetical protein
MDPEGTSRDDLDVRLDWPGEGPEGAQDRQELERRNGADRTMVPESQGDPRSSPVPQKPRGSVSQELELDTVRATLALMSARLDALASALEGARLSYTTVGAATERLEQSLAALMRTTTEVNQRTEMAIRGLGETMELAASQLEALRRRIALRGRAEDMSSEEMIELIAGAVAERLVEGSKSSGEAAVSSRRRRRGS